MEEQTKKIVKMNNLLSMFDSKYNMRYKKLPLDVAKARLRVKDPGFELSNTMKGLNEGMGKIALAHFISDNFITPLIIKFLNKR